MTPNEKRILSTIIKAVRSQNKNAWWELKRQIFEGGYQPYYPAQGDFDVQAVQAISCLPSEVKDSLVAEWRRSNKGTTGISSEKILNFYQKMIVEEIVERARIAALRTYNW